MLLERSPVGLPAGTWLNLIKATEPPHQHTLVDVSVRDFRQLSLRQS
jgi:hypothetical protein